MSSRRVSTEAERRYTVALPDTPETRKKAGATHQRAIELLGSGARISFGIGLREGKEGRPLLAMTVAHRGGDPDAYNRIVSRFQRA